METYSKNSIIKLGRGNGIEILNTIKEAKSSVKVVSPYLSPDYIKELVELSKKGIDVTLITCDNIERDLKYSDFKHEDIIRQEKIEDKKSKSLKSTLYVISFILFMITLISLSLIVINPALGFIPVLLFIITLFILISAWIINDYKYKYYPIFKLKVFDSKSGINPQSTNLIHAKIFLIDDEILYLGSANFTYSAFKTHYETVIKILDQKAIQEVNKEIENIFNSRELKEKSLSDIYQG